MACWSRTNKGGVLSRDGALVASTPSPRFTRRVQGPCWPLSGRASTLTRQGSLATKTGASGVEGLLAVLPGCPSPCRSGRPSACARPLVDVVVGHISPREHHLLAVDVAEAHEAPELRVAARRDDGVLAAARDDHVVPVVRVRVVPLGRRLGPVDTIP